MLFNFLLTCTDYQPTIQPDLRIGAENKATVCFPGDSVSNIVRKTK